MTKPRSEFAALLVVLGLALTGVVLGYGIGHPAASGAPQPEASRDAPASSIPLALPPSTVIHPPIICRKSGCTPLESGAP